LAQLHAATSSSFARRMSCARPAVAALADAALGAMIAAWLAVML
jgi:hypothetical protein